MMIKGVFAVFWRGIVSSDSNGVPLSVVERELVNSNGIKMRVRVRNYSLLLK
jgi:hypothetical protein